MKVFVDTNFFLQLKDIASLPWADISKEKELCVLVPRTVQGEIDQLKQDGSGRRSKRARKASSFLREVLKAKGQTLVVRESKPRVLVSFPPISCPGKASSTLDPTRADDQIVGEVLDYSNAHPDEEVVLLTNDTGPMLTARYHNVSYLEVPESWMLEPEPDERDKTIQELRRRLDALERSHPVVEISAWTHDRPITEVEVEIATFRPLSEPLIDEIFAEIITRCPMAEEFGSSGTELLYQQTVAVGLGCGRRYQPPTDDEIKQYREVVYPEWLKCVREFIVELPLRLNRPHSFSAVEFRLQNVGTLPATNALVEINAYGTALAQAPQKQPPGASLSIPAPPKPPAGRFSTVTSAFSAGPDLDRLRGLEATLSPANYAPQRDRNAFYWKVKPIIPTEFLSLECDEFRHQDNPEPFHIHVVLPHSATTNGSVTCRFSAANLPMPSTLTVPVKVLRNDGDTESYARRLVRELPNRPRVGLIGGQTFEL